MQRKEVEPIEVEHLAGNRMRLYAADHTLVHDNYRARPGAAAELARRHGAQTTVPDWRERLILFRV